VRETDYTILTEVFRRGITAQGKIAIISLENYRSCRRYLKLLTDNDANNFLCSKIQFGALPLKGQSFRSRLVTDDCGLYMMRDSLGLTIQSYQRSSRSGGEWVYLLENKHFSCLVSRQETRSRPTEIKRHTQNNISQIKK
jgi:hypothetical protein